MLQRILSLPTFADAKVFKKVEGFSNCSQVDANFDIRSSLGKVSGNHFIGNEAWSTVGEHRRRSGRLEEKLRRVIDISCMKSPAHASNEEQNLDLVKKENLSWSLMKGGLRRNTVTLWYTADPYLKPQQ